MYNLRDEIVLIRSDLITYVQTIYDNYTDKSYSKYNIDINGKKIIDKLSLSYLIHLKIYEYINSKLDNKISDYKIISMFDDVFVLISDKDNNTYYINIPNYLFEYKVSNKYIKSSGLKFNEYDVIIGKY